MVEATVIWLIVLSVVVYLAVGFTLAHFALNDPQSIDTPLWVGGMLVLLWAAILAGGLIIWVPYGILHTLGSLAKGSQQPKNQ